MTWFWVVLPWVALAGFAGALLVGEAFGIAKVEAGRLSAFIEPRDIWVGVYVAPRAVYVCPLPCLVLRWRR